jgi:aspartate 1-decarboxylase
MVSKMLVNLLKSKIHDCNVTGAERDYVGSIGICPNLMRACGLVENERVLVANISNGQRLETYVIEGDVGDIVLNGAAAHHFKKGDRAIIMAFAMFSEEEAKNHKPQIIHVDGDNKVLEK